MAKQAAREPIVLVVGLGEVGGALFELLKESGKFEVYGLDVDKKKMQEFKQGNLPDKVGILHICIGCRDQEEFVKATVGYMKQFKPELTIIESTVPPGTTQKINTLSESHLAHSPVRGMHKKGRAMMKSHVISLVKYIGGIDEESNRLAQKHFANLGLKTKFLNSPVETELAKLFETTYRAWLIACFQEMHRISRHFGADFVNVVDFLEDTHRIRFDRPIMYPDVIGGHCLIPNTKLLLESYDSEFLKLILNSNELRKREIEEDEVMIEVQRVKHRVKNLEDWLKRLREA